MFGFFEGFKRGCGCTLGVIAGLAIAAIIIGVLFGGVRFAP